MEEDASRYRGKAPDENIGRHRSVGPAPLPRFLTALDQNDTVGDRKPPKVISPVIRAPPGLRRRDRWVVGRHPREYRCNNDLSQRHPKHKCTDRSQPGRISEAEPQTDRRIDVVALEIAVSQSTIHLREHEAGIDIPTSVRTSIDSAGDRIERTGALRVLAAGARRRPGGGAEEGILDIYPVHVMTRKSFGLMMRKLSVTESQRSAQFPGTFSRRKLSVASANWAQVA